MQLLVNSVPQVAMSFCDPVTDFTQRIGCAVGEVRSRAIETLSSKVQAKLLQPLEFYDNQAFIDALFEAAACSPNLLYSVNNLLEISLPALSGRTHAQNSDKLDVSGGSTTDGSIGSPWRSQMASAVHEERVLRRLLQALQSFTGEIPPSEKPAAPGSGPANSARTAIDVTPPRALMSDERAERHRTESLLGHVKHLLSITDAPRARNPAEEEETETPFTALQQSAASVSATALQTPSSKRTPGLPSPPLPSSPLPSSPLPSSVVKALDFFHDMPSGGESRCLALEVIQRELDSAVLSSQHECRVRGACALAVASDSLAASPEDLHLQTLARQLADAFARAQDTRVNELLEQIRTACLSPVCWPVAQSGTSLSTLLGIACHSGMDADVRWRAWDTVLLSLQRLVQTGHSCAQPVLLACGKVACKAFKRSLLPLVPQVVLTTLACLAGAHLKTWDHGALFDIQSVLFECACGLLGLGEERHRLLPDARMLLLHERFCGLSPLHKLTFLHLSCASAAIAKVSSATLLATYRRDASEDAVVAAPVELLDLLAAAYLFSDMYELGGEDQRVALKQTLENAAHVFHAVTEELQGLKIVRTLMANIPVRLDGEAKRHIRAVFTELKARLGISEEALANFVALAVTPELLSEQQLVYALHAIAEDAITNSTTTSSPSNVCTKVFFRIISNHSVFLRRALLQATSAVLRQLRMAPAQLGWLLHVLADTCAFHIDVLLREETKRIFDTAVELLLLTPDLGIDGANLLVFASLYATENPAVCHAMLSKLKTFEPASHLLLSLPLLFADPTCEPVLAVVASLLSIPPSAVRPYVCSHEGRPEGGEVVTPLVPSEIDTIINDAILHGSGAPTNKTIISSLELATIVDGIVSALGNEQDTRILASALESFSSLLTDFHTGLQDLLPLLHRPLSDVICTDAGRLLHNALVALECCLAFSRASFDAARGDAALIKTLALLCVNSAALDGVEAEAEVLGNDNHFTVNVLPTRLLATRILARLLFQRPSVPSHGFLTLPVNVRMDDDGEEVPCDSRVHVCCMVWNRVPLLRTPCVAHAFGHAGICPSVVVDKAAFEWQLLHQRHTLTTALAAGERNVFSMEDVARLLQTASLADCTLEQRLVFSACVNTLRPCHVRIVQEALEQAAGADVLFPSFKHSLQQHVAILRLAFPFRSITPGTFIHACQLNAAEATLKAASECLLEDISIFFVFSCMEAIVDALTAIAASTTSCPGSLTSCTSCQQLARLLGMKAVPMLVEFSRNQHTALFDSLLFRFSLVLTRHAPALLQVARTDDALLQQCLFCVAEHVPETPVEIDVFRQRSQLSCTFQWLRTCCCMLSELRSDGLLTFSGIAFPTCVTNCVLSLSSAPSSWMAEAWYGDAVDAARFTLLSSDATMLELLAPGIPSFLLQLEACLLEVCSVDFSDAAVAHVHNDRYSALASTAASLIQLVTVIGRAGTPVPLDEGNTTLLISAVKQLNEANDASALGQQLQRLSTLLLEMLSSANAPMSAAQWRSILMSKPYFSGCQRLFVTTDVDMGALTPTEQGHVEDILVQYAKQPWVCVVDLEGFSEVLKKLLALPTCNGTALLGSCIGAAVDALETCMATCSAPVILSVLLLLRACAQESDACSLLPSPLLSRVQTLTCNLICDLGSVAIATSPPHSHSSAQSTPDASFLTDVSSIAKIPSFYLHSELLERSVAAVDASMLQHGADNGQSLQAPLALASRHFVLRRHACVHPLLSSLLSSPLASPQGGKGAASRSEFLYTSALLGLMNIIMQAATNTLQLSATYGVFVKNSHVSETRFLTAACRATADAATASLMMSRSTTFVEDVVVFCTYQQADLLWRCVASCAREGKREASDAETLVRNLADAILCVLHTDAQLARAARPVPQCSGLACRVLSTTYDLIVADVTLAHVCEQTTLGGLPLYVHMVQEFIGCKESKDVGLAEMLANLLSACIYALPSLRHALSSNHASLSALCRALSSQRHPFSHISKTDCRWFIAGFKVLCSLAANEEEYILVKLSSFMETLCNALVDIHAILFDKHARPDYSLINLTERVLQLLSYLSTLKGNDRWWIAHKGVLEATIGCLGYSAAPAISEAARFCLHSLAKSSARFRSQLKHTHSTVFQGLLAPATSPTAAATATGGSTTTGSRDTTAGNITSASVSGGTGK